METEIRKSQTDAERGEKSSKRGRDRCLLSLPCLPLCLCPSCEHSAAVAHNLYFIHYSQLRIDWEQGTYHRSARGRERWKGRNVQLDQREGCTAKRTNVHHGCVWASMCVCVCVCGFLGAWAQSQPCCTCGREPGVLMCDSQHRAVAPVVHIRLNQWCWHTHTHSHVPPTECCFCSIL